jgi:hypothetical protein
MWWRAFPCNDGELPRIRKLHLLPSFSRYCLSPDLHSLRLFCKSAVTRQAIHRPSHDGSYISEFVTTAISPPQNKYSQKMWHESRHISDKKKIICYVQLLYITLKLPHWVMPSVTMFRYGMPTSYFCASNVKIRTPVNINHLFN